MRTKKRFYLATIFQCLLLFKKKKLELNEKLLTDLVKVETKFYEKSEKLPLFTLNKAK